MHTQSSISHCFYLLIYILIPWNKMFALLIGDESWDACCDLWLFSQPDNAMPHDFPREFIQQNLRCCSRALQHRMSWKKADWSTFSQSTASGRQKLSGSDPVTWSCYHLLTSLLAFTLQLKWSYKVLINNALSSEIRSVICLNVKIWWQRMIREPARLLQAARRPFAVGKKL